MDVTLGLDIEKNEIERYLSSGLQTQITPEINKIVSDINGTVLEKTEKILKLGSTLVEMKDFDKGVFRKRTASQIIVDWRSCVCSSI